MKPIKLEAIENPTILEINEKELLEGYEEIALYHFMPEFFEKVYDGSNAEQLKEANNFLLEYANNRDKYKYIGTHIYKPSSSEVDYIEYYYDDESNILVYLITKPKKYYSSLQMVCVHKPNENKEVS